MVAFQGSLINLVLKKYGTNVLRTIRVDVPQANYFVKL